MAICRSRYTRGEEVIGRCTPWPALRGEELGMKGNELIIIKADYAMTKLSAQASPAQTKIQTDERDGKHKGKEGNP